MYLLFVGASYFLAQFGSLYGQSVLGGNTGIWPAAAVGLIGIIGAPDGWRWRVALSTLVANVAAHAVVDGLSVMTLGVFVRLAADWGGALVVIRVLGERPNLERSAPLLKFVALVGFVITPVVSLVAAIAIVQLIPTAGPLGSVFLRWYVPEVVMTLMLAPALWVGLAGVARFRRTPWRVMVERGLALLALVMVIIVVTLQPNVAGLVLPISSVAVPALIFLAFRYGVGTTAWASVAMLATILTVTALGAGPFAATRAPGYAQLVTAELYVGALGISITLLAAVLSDLRAASARFQSFLDTVDDAIIAVDLDRRIVGFSPSADRMFVERTGHPLELGLDPLAPQQGTPEVMSRRGAGWQRALEGAQDIAILEPDHRTRVEMRYAPMRNRAGDVVGAVATATDLRQRERSDQAKVRAERLEAIGRLAGGIAHDVNNLMTIVLGQTYLLRTEMHAQPNAFESLDEIEATVERTTRLTGQLLAFSRAQALTPRVVTLAGQVDASAALLRRIIEEETIIEVEHRAPSTRVVLDVGQFEQVLLNLATNARDAMPDGGRLSIVTDAVTLDPSDAAPLDLPAGAYATLVVRDSGRGIAADVIDDVFEPFFTTKGDKGTGLGLATVYAVMRKLGGAIKASSEVGIGTTFTMWFPQSDAVLDVVPQAQSTPASTHVRARVLVCEDDAVIRRIVIRTLTNAGFSAHDAATPADALAWLDGAGSDTELLVSDLVMPGMSGIELQREARKRSPRLRVLIMTGYAGDKLANLTEADRPDRILSKPFTGANLVALVTELCDGFPVSPPTPVGVH